MAAQRDTKSPAQQPGQDQTTAEQRQAQAAEAEKKAQETAAVPNSAPMGTPDRPKDKARTTAREAAEKSAKEGHKTGQRPGTTVMEGEEFGKPGHVAPGDAPADTMDPTERVSTVIFGGTAAAEAAKAGYGSVVSAVKLPDPAQAAREVKGGRTERYPVTVNAITGETVEVEHNMDTGESKRV